MGHAQRSQRGVEFPLPVWAGFTFSLGTSNLSAGVQFPSFGSPCVVSPLVVRSRSQPTHSLRRRGLRALDVLNAHLFVNSRSQQVSFGDRVLCVVLAHRSPRIVGHNCGARASYPNGLSHVKTRGHEWIVTSVTRLAHSFSSNPRTISEHPASLFAHPKP